MHLPSVTSVIVALLACFLQEMPVTAQDTKVMKYRGTETAPYRVLGSYHQGDSYYAYEMREYPAASWITTGSSTGFGILFQYISGNNAGGKKIKMTSPVLNTVYYAENYSYEMAFYLPQVYQQNPPAPLDPRATLKFFPTMTVFVRTYGGWSNSRVEQMELRKLVTALNYDKRKFRSDVVSTAGYDGPWTFRSRRNEIWLIANEK